MNTQTRAKAFQAPAREERAALKEGQRRCPMCFRGIMPMSNGKFHWHNEGNGIRCEASSLVYAGYVYRGKGVDTMAENG